MALNLEDYFKTVFEEQLSKKVPGRERDLMTGATRLLEKRSEITQVDKRLKTHREEFELKKQSFVQQRKELMMKEESLKESLLKFDKFLKENDAKRSRGAKKAEKEREAVLQKEAEIERLKDECAILEARRQTLQGRVERSALYWNFLEQVLRMSKFEEVWELLGRFETLVTTRDQLRQREIEVQEQVDSLRGALQRYTDQQSCLLVHNNNLLSQLQSQLDQARSDALRWESKWNHIQTTAAKETLLLGQIKVVTLNLYHMTGGQTDQEEGVAIDNTEAQLDKIQLFIKDQAAIVSHIQGQNPADDKE
ncbi:coiled-coil domain-containing protein 42 homolog [Hypomesus transpacificus]|uniref:coiled-coil domain-containing protein 42 homolog n=1 Tax=Hypomesus transpacificus TaxID=137520 RepID=UPI001F07DFA8|nr:coiled-coil domain-containing protein 42 homolog [Hypomesus transpacificus]XP_046904690.1 coiled-coil domain-containing protein 42 homolog [Hypomesus transpacificus]XP_046904691.1 coiled-coil domain-containing protein 42 homolog [Hypomesus transpacificus]XP_046904693.1 coiled-coil domain-containing protein 42 homolog [Hypomesus transpacificus]XP_046904694.1 coiled-coil domain-containing protein 42 homolog [Hypomesus transpacificus]XP_046904695.1 coiled-coil domain-containing protein 42 homo